MYTRPYNDEGLEIRIPENYVGTAFSEPTREEVTDEVAEPTEYEETLSVKTDKSEGIFSRLFGRGLSDIIPKSILGGMPKSIGVEEILLVGLGIFLFLSGSHDTLTAIILIGLIFVN